MNKTNSKHVFNFHFLNIIYFLNSFCLRPLVPVLASSSGIIPVRICLWLKAVVPFVIWIASLLLIFTMQLGSIIRIGDMMSCWSIRYIVVHNVLSLAYSASRNSRSMISFQSLKRWFTEHFPIPYCRQPIRDRGRKEITSARSSTFYERSYSEFLQTWSWGRERLASTCSPSVSMLVKRKFRISW